MLTHLIHRIEDSRREVLDPIKVEKGNVDISFNVFIYNKTANGATTYPGLQNHTAVRSKEYASPTRLARSTSGKVPPARFVDRSPSIRPAHGNHKNKPPN